MPLNSIEQTATKTEQQRDYRARQLSFGNVSNVLPGLSLIPTLASAHTPIPRSVFAAAAIASVAVPKENSVTFS